MFVTITVESPFWLALLKRREKGKCEHDISVYSIWLSLRGNGTGESLVYTSKKVIEISANQ